MGVVYKFRKEVIDFVLEQKRVDPDLGCRHLAVLTSEKFKIQVSKSSVNAIIKNARLSSAVGRPVSSEATPKKFQIPAQKKQQLFGEIRKVALPPPPRRQPPGESRKRPQAPEIFLRHIERVKTRRSRERGVVREGMGCVFLKAAQWQLSKAPVLARLVRKYVPEVLPPEFDAFCDLWSCFNVLGVSDPSQIGQWTNRGLWVMNGFDNLPLETDLLRWFNIVKSVPSSVKFSLEYEKERQQVFLEVERFEFLLENDSRVILDPQLAGFWENRVPAEYAACLEQAMTRLSGEVISNNRPAIFLSSGRKRFPSQLPDMFGAFEGLEGKGLKKVGVFDQGGDRIAEFASFPHKKRIFMLGVWPWQEEFVLWQNIKAAEPFYDEIGDRIFYLGAAPVSGLPKEFLRAVPGMKAIGVSRSLETGPEMVILTNATDKGPGDIFRVFLDRWLNLDKGPAGKFLEALGGSQETRAPVLNQDRFRTVQGVAASNRDTTDSTFSPATLTPLESEQNISGVQKHDSLTIFRDWGQRLARYCRKHFWKGMAGEDANILKSICCDVPGRYLPQGEVLLVSLCPLAGYPYINELQLAVARLNEANVVDSSGRRMVVRLIK